MKSLFGFVIVNASGTCELVVNLGLLFRKEVVFLRSVPKVYLGLLQ